MIWEMCHEILSYNLVALDFKVLFNTEFFPGPPAFCKKAVERVNSEKNILNSSVVWSSMEWKISIKVIYIYIIKSGSMS